MFPKTELFGLWPGGGGGGVESAHGLAQLVSLWPHGGVRGAGVLIAVREKPPAKTHWTAKG